MTPWLQRRRQLRADALVINIDHFWTLRGQVSFKIQTPDFQDAEEVKVMNKTTIRLSEFTRTDSRRLPSARACP